VVRSPLPGCVLREAQPEGDRPADQPAGRTTAHWFTTGTWAAGAALQWAETGIFVALALVLAGFCCWWIRRRLLA
jgi:hypothetical protein